MEVLKATFSGRWIGRSDSVLWPPMSPDLTLIFSFGVCKKWRLYGQSSTPESFESKNKGSHWEVGKRYAAAYVAKRGISIRHMQGQEWRTCGN